MKKLELYGTFGPSCCSEEVLGKMMAAGMTGIRLNLSHKSLAECEEWLQALRAVSARYHFFPDLLVDLQGPELRIGTFADKYLKEGDVVRFLTQEDYDQLIQKDQPLAIPVPMQVLPYLKEGQTLRLDDGRLPFEIVDEDERKAKVLHGGPLTSKKSIVVDGITVSMPTLTPADLNNIKNFKRYGVTGVMLPFVRSREDLLELKRTLMEHDLIHVRIFAKIENMEGVRKLPELLPHCDQIVIARGDLGNAVPLSKLIAVQKEIAMVCRQTRTPFMVVTQMLASMEHNHVPTRAEVSDVFNAILDGASSIMLTGETAVGDYPVEAMQIFSDTAFEALKYTKQKGLHYII